MSDDTNDGDRSRSPMPDQVEPVAPSKPKRGRPTMFNASRAARFLTARFE